MSTTTSVKCHITSNGKMNSNSSIPLRKQLSRRASTPTSPSRIPVNDPAHRWKQKFEEAEDRRKLLLTEKEKVLRNLNELEKKHMNLQIKHEQLETELFEKNEEFTRLSTASKNLYREYEILKNQYETETRAMSGALKDATQWYKENKELKRKTMLLMDKDAVDEGVDAGDGESTGDNDIENLNKTIKQLSAEVAELQTEVDQLKQQEFQTTEENVKLSEDLESERRKTEKLESKLDDFQKKHDQQLRVMEMMRKELEEYKQKEEEHRQSLAALKKESAAHKRERNVLAHQSTLILQGLNENDNSGDYMMLLQEIEDLKRTLEDDRNKYEEEISVLQERIEEQSSFPPDPQVEILEERLRLAESELAVAQRRAEEAEERLRSPPPPPPPPPPPMPPQAPLRRRRSRLLIDGGGTTPARQLEEEQKLLEEKTNKADLLTAAGSPEKKPAAAVPCANEDIINAIKAGQFTLRKPKKEKESKDKEQQPNAVSELLNILSSLRRAPKKRQSQFIGDKNVLFFGRYNNASPRGTRLAKLFSQQLKMSRDTFKMVQPIIVVSRLLGLFPISFKDCGCFFVLQWSHFYAIYSVIGPGIFAAITMSVVVKHEDQRDAHESDNKRVFLTAFDTFCVTMIVLFCVVSNPFKMISIWKMCSLISEVEKVIHIRNNKTYIRKSILSIIGMLVGFVLFYSFDIVTWHVSLKRIESFKSFFESFFCFYVLKFIMLGEILLFCHTVYFLQIRLIALREHFLDVVQDKIVVVTDFKNGEMQICPYVLAAKSNANKANSILEIAKCQKRIYDASEIINSTPGFGIVIIMFSILLHLTVTPYFLLTEIQKGGSTLFIVLQSCWVIVHCLKFYAIIESCDMCQNEGDKMLDNVQRVLADYAEESPLKSALIRFAMQLSQCEIRFNTSGLFSLDRSIFTSFVAAITTYLVVLIQMNSQ
nr:unnamed protein product [Callosobruchus chinensis]